jgi:hypothetical protein
MEQQRFVVTDEEMVELKAELLGVQADAKEVWSNFVNPRRHHAPFGASRRSSPELSRRGLLIHPGVVQADGLHHI